MKIVNNNFSIESIFDENFDYSNFNVKFDLIARGYECKDFGKWADFTQQGLFYALGSIKNPKAPTLKMFTTYKSFLRINGLMNNNNKLKKLVVKKKDIIQDEDQSKIL